MAYHYAPDSPTSLVHATDCMAHQAKISSARKFKRSVHCAGVDTHISSSSLKMNSSVALVASINSNESRQQLQGAEQEGTCSAQMQILQSSDRLQNGSLFPKSNFSMPPSPPQTPTTSAGADFTFEAPSTKKSSISPYPRFYHAIPPSLIRCRRAQSVWTHVKEPGGEQISVPMEDGILRRRSFSKRPPLSQLREQPEYEIHVGDPCTLNCLDHVLACQHRIITLKPEPCGSTCHAREYPDYSQARDIDSSFVCMQCIVDHLQVRHSQRYSTYRGELENVALGTGRGQGWVAAKLEYIEVAWKEQDIEEMRDLCEVGKFSHPFHLDAIPAEFREMVASALQARCKAISQTRRASAGSMRSAVSATGSIAGRNTLSSASDVRSSDSSIAGTILSVTGRESQLPKQWRQSVQQLFKTKAVA